MPTKPLVSLLVLAYRNSHLMGDVLNSILEQDYENIELILSDDASGDFDPRKISHHVESNNRGNIKRLLINVNHENMGTVKHANKVLGLSSGQYLKFIAADDALYNQETISAFVDFFQRTDALVVASQCLIYDESLTKPLGLCLSKEQTQLIQKLKPQELFLALIQNHLIHALGVGFSRRFFEKYGAFDEHYHIDEDRPMWLRISRLGCPIHYMDRITTKYRLGGISRQNTRCDERPRVSYVEDLIQIWGREILPYREKLGDPLWRKLTLDYVRQYEWPSTFSEPAPLRFF